MSDFRSLQLALIDELRNSKAFEAVGRAIVDALRFHRGYDFYFNSGTFAIACASQVFEYPLPTDLVQVRGRLQVEPAPGTRKLSMRPATEDELDHLREGIGEIGSVGQASRGVPRRYSIGDGGLRLYPTPDRDGMVVSGRMIVDLGAPSYRYDPVLPGWVFVDPAGDVVGEGFTNAWFTEAFELLRSRGAYLLYTQEFENPARAEVSLRRWVESLNQLRAETARRRASGARRGYF